MKAPPCQKPVPAGRDEQRFVERTGTASFEVRVITYAEPAPQRSLDTR